MRQKTIPVIGHYIVNSIEITELAEAFRHYLNDLMNGKLGESTLYPVQAMSRDILLSEKSALKLSHMIHSIEFRVPTSYGMYNLRIRKTGSIDDNEVIFT